MYEKTIGGLNLIYNGVASNSTPTKVYDMLVLADQQELSLILNNNRGNLKVIVDGYLTSADPFYVCHKIDGFKELVYAKERYPIPVYMWQNSVYVQGTVSSQPITIRFVAS
jgi:hypothetical protein